MIAFSRYLEERFRSPEEAVSLVDRLSAKRLAEPELDHPSVRGKPAARQMRPLVPVVKKNPWAMAYDGGKIEDVPLDRVRTTQRTVSPEVVKSKIKDPGDKPPIMVRHRGQYYVQDGNHSASAARARGEHSIRAVVHDRLSLFNILRGNFNPA